MDAVCATNLTGRTWRKLTLLPAVLEYPRHGRTGRTEGTGVGAQRLPCSRSRYSTLCAVGAHDRWCVRGGCEECRNHDGVQVERWCAVFVVMCSHGARLAAEGGAYLCRMLWWSVALADAHLFVANVMLSKIMMRFLCISCLM